MQADFQELLNDLEKLDAAAEKVVSSQEKCKLYEINRRKSQEAINRLNDSNAPNKVWACLSHQFFKLPKDSLKAALKADVNTLSTEIKYLREEIKRDLDELRKLEGKDSLKGFNLKPLTSEEISAITGIY